MTECNIRHSAFTYHK